ncbi:MULTISPECIES: hypothetical protein [Cyanophyceae]|uniref:hypothetical protein n=1 Tax=Cyanophyceae TaxID=3028117 RepID=UPI00168841A8|nr:MULTISPECIES: hypothetical protein [Cyanophyceae]MBD1918080.1 hypothetical protein [Phormidium sp. FACHB-77]MBD2030113.1 hypothetical protein [Phormidium sp. FACHB-322]MBD2051516.1 hypothetical protein [Leptolyngbya sp. FACHB-60]
MVRSLTLWFIWLSFIICVLFFAPPLQRDTLQPLQSILAGQIPSINPVILSLFSLVGIWLLIYSCLIFADGRMQNLPAWVFMLASIASGVIALIPYLALRQPNRSFSGEKDPWIAVLDSQMTGVVLTISTIVLVLYAILWGDWAAFAQEFMTNRFIYGMSIAFGLFCVLFPYPTLLKDDMARRGLEPDSQLFNIAAWIPLFGPLAYLCLRPSLLAFRFRNQSLSNR